MDERKIQNKSKYEIESIRMYIPLFFIATSIILELINFKYIGFEINGGAKLTFPEIWIFNIASILIIAGIIYAVKKKWAMTVVFFFFVGLQVILNLVNANIYSIFGDLFTLEHLNLGMETSAAFSWSLIDVLSIFLYLGILAVIIFCYILMLKFCKKTIHLQKFSNIVFSLVFVLITEFTGLTMIDNQIKILNQTSETRVEGNQSFLWQSFALKCEAYKQFGFYGFYIKNIYDNIFYETALPASQEIELKNYIQSGETIVDDLDNSLAGDNMIVILCESFDTIAIDPVNTPFLYNMVHGDASAFTNFHGYNKTSTSEQIVMTGNIFDSTTLYSLVNDYSGYEYKYTLPRLFKEKYPNAQANYFHSYIESFYDRVDTYTTNELGYGVGFDNLYGLEAYSGEKSTVFGEWIREEDYVIDMADKLIPETDEPFLSYYATVSMHGPHEYRENFEDLYAEYDSNFNDYKDYLNSIGMGYVLDDNELLSELRYYKAAAIDFNNAMRKLFEKLEEKGKLHNTTVVMFGDHNAYYKNFCYRMKGVEPLSSQIKGYNIPLIIYNDKLTKGQYDMFCNTYDIYPTICELHGLTYNKNLTQGYNLFSSDIENSFFASHMTDQMFTDKFYSKNITDVEWLSQNCTDEDLKKFKTLAEQFYVRQEKIELIYLFNLAK